MNRKIFAILAALALAVAAAGCGNGQQSAASGAAAAPASAPAASAPAPAPAPEPEPEPVPPDLTGEWIEADSQSAETWQAATVTADTIEVYWVSDGGDTTALYWAGSYTPPETAEEPYTWTSANDTERTGMALMASGDATKDFTYQDGQISYSVSMMGVTTKIHLEKAK